VKQLIIFVSVGIISLAVISFGGTYYHSYSIGKSYKRQVCLGLIKEEFALAAINRTIGELDHKIRLKTFLSFKDCTQFLPEVQNATN
jgi:hypothetical protein